MPRKKETAESESVEDVAPAAEAPVEEPTDADHQESGSGVAGVTDESVEAPGEANQPSPNSFPTCANHPDREATQKTTTPGASPVLFCDECAQNAGEGTQPIAAGEDADPAEVERQQAQAGPPPTPEEIAAAQEAAGEG